MLILERSLVFLFLIFWVSISFTQKVTVSTEINARNDRSYEILTNIDDHILFYHDKGQEHRFEIFDDQLRLKYNKKIDFEEKGVNTICMLPSDTSFSFYYNCFEDGKLLTKVKRFDKNIKLIDSTTISNRDRKYGEPPTRYIFSKDKSKLLLFGTDDKNMQLLLVDSKELKPIVEFKLMLEDINLRTDFEQVLVTNAGHIYISTKESSFWGNDDEDNFNVIHVIDENNIKVHNFSPDIDKINSFLMDFDELNGRIVLAGLAGKGDEMSSTGYFGFSIPSSDLPVEAEILINKFTMEFIADVVGKKVGKSKEISSYKLRDLVIRQDGGVILICESSKEYYRRAQMNNPGQFGGFASAQGYVDYYHEDIILMANFSDGKEHWKKVLFKKQFSQDDEGIFSSYFLFKTPSRLRLIYNDEIKNSNTVSEYVVDAMGNFSRSSILSTEYQNLKLRFRDAVQIGSKTLIVPSEKNWKINLVKIDL